MPGERSGLRSKGSCGWVDGWLGGWVAGWLGGWVSFATRVGTLLQAHFLPDKLDAALESESWVWRLS